MKASGYRIELAMPKRRTVTHWPTWKLTDDHCVAAFKAILGQPVTRREKRLARNVAEMLITAARRRAARDWMDKEGERLEQLRLERNAKRRAEYARSKDRRPRGRK